MVPGRPPCACVSVRASVSVRVLGQLRVSVNDHAVDNVKGSGLEHGLRSIPVRAVRAVHDGCLDGGMAWEAICGIPSRGDSTSSNRGGCMHLSFV